LPAIRCSKGAYSRARAADAVTEPLCAASLRASDVVLVDLRRQAPAEHRDPCRRGRSSADVEELRLLRDGTAMQAALTRLEAWHGIVRTGARVARGGP